MSDLMTKKVSKKLPYHLYWHIVQREEREKINLGRVVVNFSIYYIVHNLPPFPDVCYLVSGVNNDTRTSGYLYPDC